MEAGDSERFSPAERRLLLRGGVVAVALVSGFIAWLATRDNGGGEAPVPAEAAAVRVVSAAGLREASARLGQPIYWAGPIAGKELELEELGEGGVQVLYLPEGTEAGKGSPQSLTIGSYPMSNPAAALEGLAKRPGAVVRHASNGREVATSRQGPTSVYFASPDNRVQVEVYDPSPERAMSLALSRRVQPVG